MGLAFGLFQQTKDSLNLYLRSLTQKRERGCRTREILCQGRRRWSGVMIPTIEDRGGLIKRGDRPWCGLNGGHSDDYNYYIQEGRSDGTEKR